MSYFISVPLGKGGSSDEALFVRAANSFEPSGTDALS